MAVTEWYKAPIPRRLHRCRDYSARQIGRDWIERCACGAIRFNGRVWLDKNSRRKHER